MKTKELLEIIGEIVGTIIIAGRYGNATFHRKGYFSCDACYIRDGAESLGARISAAHVALYPWEGRNYREHDSKWMPFELDGHTLYARSCSDGTGHFGNCVDTGWVVVFPFDMAPDSMKEKWAEAEKQYENLDPRWNAHLQTA